MEAYSKEFKCPVCELKAWLIVILKIDEPYLPPLEGFFEGIVKEMKESGMVKGDWAFSLDSKEGPVADDRLLGSLPIGSEIPGYGFVTDICPECGCIYTRMLRRRVMKKGLAPVELFNREQRRHGFQMPPLQN